MWNWKPCSQGVFSVTRLLASLALLAFAACTGGSVVRPNASLDASADESIVVIGVGPADFTLIATPGEIRSGLFDMKSWSRPVIYGAPQGGYLVARAKAAEPLAITSITHNDHAFHPKRFTPCGDTQTHSWVVPAGKVLFLGQFEFERQGENLSVTTRFDIDGAKAYLRQHHPGLESRVEAAPSTMRATTRLCSSDAGGPTIYWTAPSRRR